MSDWCPLEGEGEGETVGTGEVSFGGAWQGEDTREPQ